MIKASIVLFGLLVVATEIKSDGVHTHVDSGAQTPSPGNYDIPPPPNDPPTATPGVPLAGVPPVPVGGGLLGFPGFGFQKSLNLNAGAGFGGVPFGGFGVGGGIPPIGGDIPPVGGLGGFGGFTPAYLPSSWLGSLMGAKGDFLFPCVIVIFFIVGIWTVINFLLVLIVPLIGAKLGVVKAITGGRLRRGIEEDSHDAPRPEIAAQNVTDAIAAGDKKYS